jgi:hypothetical protein
VRGILPAIQFPLHQIIIFNLKSLNLIPVSPFSKVEKVEYKNAGRKPQEKYIIFDVSFEKTA